MTKKLRRCNRAGKVVFETELDAKIALASRVWKDKGEKRYYPCPNGHFHLTSQEKGEGRQALTPQRAA